MQNREWRDCFSIVEIIPRGSIYNENPFSCVNGLSHLVVSQPIAKAILYALFSSNFYFIQKSTRWTKEVLESNSKEEIKFPQSEIWFGNNWFIIRTQRDIDQCLSYIRTIELVWLEDSLLKIHLIHFTKFWLCLSRTSHLRTISIVNIMQILSIMYYWVFYATHLQ